MKVNQSPLSINPFLPKNEKWLKKMKQKPWVLRLMRKVNADRRSTITVFESKKEGFKGFKITSGVYGTKTYFV